MSKHVVGSKYAEEVWQVSEDVVSSQQQAGCSLYYPLVQPLLPLSAARLLEADR